MNTRVHLKHYIDRFESPYKANNKIKASALAEKIVWKYQNRFWEASLRGYQILQV